MNPKILTLFAFLLFSGGTVRAEMVEGYYAQKLDHQNRLDKRTFGQRYLIDSSAASGPNAPVLYFVGNESELRSLIDRTSIPNIAYKLGAHFVALEHRYYGKSQPFAKLTTRNLRYLTFDNALKDLAGFENYLIQDRGFKGKWFAVGRSYGANLAAFYRQKYPLLVVGSLASSPGLIAVRSWSEYDRAAAEAVGLECTAKYRASVLSKIEGALQKPEMAALKDLFGGTGIKDDLQFLYAVGQASAFMIAMDGTKRFCDNLQGEADVPLNKFGRLLNQFLVDDQDHLSDFTNEGTTNTDVHKYENGFGGRQWAYQTCTELSWLATAYPDPKTSLQSPKADSVALTSCKEIFGLKKLADVDKTNRGYYLRLLDPKTTNILIVNGTKDPTATLSISKENGNDVNPNLTIYTLIGGSHHSEFGVEKESDPQPVKDARAFELKTIRGWLAN